MPNLQRYVPKLNLCASALQSITTEANLAEKVEEEHVSVHRPSYEAGRKKKLHTQYAVNETFINSRAKFLYMYIEHTDVF